MKSINGSEFFFYNSSGFLIKDSSINNIYVYSYYADSIMELHFTPYGHGPETTKFVLNRQGLVDSVNRKKFYYNSDNFLVKVVTSGGRDTFAMVDSYTYFNGNNTAHFFTDWTTNSLYFELTHSYFDTSKFNSLTNENFGRLFLGKSNKNVSISVLSSGPPYGPHGNTYYSYSFDSASRIIAATEIDIPTTYPDTTTLTTTYSYY